MIYDALQLVKQAHGEYPTREDLTHMAECAQHGEPGACDRLILAIWHSCLIMASSLCHDPTRRDVAEDLAQHAILCCLEKMTEALEHPNPCGYFLTLARFEMHQYLRRQRVIILPSGPVEPIDVMSLESYLFGDEHDIVETPQGQEIDIAPLYEALDQLSPQAQQLIGQLFGLLGQTPTSMGDIAGGDSTTHAYQNMKAKKLRFLGYIRDYLQEHAPDYAKKHTRTKPVSRARRDIVLPTITRQKLERARDTLQSQGEKLSMNKLRKISGVHTAYASVFLHEIINQQERIG